MLNLLLLHHPTSPSPLHSCHCQYPRIKAYLYCLYRDICESRPDKEFYLVPTTTRNKPYWYTDAQPAITRLLQLQLKEIQPRLIPLPGFPSDPSSMDTDGVHFTALAGIAYCQHVIDSARLVLEHVIITSGTSPEH